MEGERVELLGDDDEQSIPIESLQAKVPERPPLEMLQPPPRKSAAEDNSPFGGVPTSLPQVSTPPMPAYYGRSRSQSLPKAPSTRTPPKYRTLEEMYTYNAADLHTEGCQIRIQRLSPQISYDEAGQRVRTSGIIGRDKPNMTTEEFQYKYGGFKYLVFLEVPLDNVDDPYGAPKLMTKAVAEFELPCEPNLNQLPGQDDNMPFNPIARRYQSPNSRYEQPRESGDSVSRVLDFAASTMRMPPSTGASDVAFQALQAQGNAAIGATKEMAQIQIETLRAQLDERSKEVAELRRSMFEMRKEPSEAEKIMQSVALLNQSQARNATEESIEALRRQHSAEIEHLRAAHRDQVDSVMRQNTVSMEALRQSCEMQIKALENRVSDMMVAADRERANMKDEVERREREAKRDGERNLEAARRDAERSIELLRAQYESRIQILEQSSRSEKHMLQESYKLVSKSDENTAAMKLTILEQENNRLKAEFASMREELEEARSERNKPLAEQLQEIKSNAELLGIGADSSAKPDIKDTLLAAAVQNAPQILGALGALAARAPAAAPGAPGATPMQHPALPPGPAAAAQAPAARRPQPPQRRRMVFQEDDSPVIETQPKPRPDLYVEPPSPPPAPVYTPTVSQPPPSASQPPPAPQQVPPPPRQPSIAPPASPEDWEPFAWTLAPTENIQGLLGLLEQACVTEEPAENIADFLGNQFGKDALKVVSDTLDIDRFCQSIIEAKATKDKVLATRRGQQFVRDVLASIKTWISNH